MNPALCIDKVLPSIDAKIPKHFVEVSSVFADVLANIIGTDQTS